MADLKPTVVYGTNFKIPELLCTQHKNDSIMSIGLYNFTMRKESDWKTLTSPPHDQRVMLNFARKVGLRFYCFVNLSNDQNKTTWKGNCESYD
eukprot:UN12145